MWTPPVRWTVWLQGYLQVNEVDQHHRTSDRQLKTVVCVYVRVRVNEWESERLRLNLKVYMGVPYGYATLKSGLVAPSLGHGMDMVDGWGWSVGVWVGHARIKDPELAIVFLSLCSLCWGFTWIILRPAATEENHTSQGALDCASTMACRTTATVVHLWIKEGRHTWWIAPTQPPQNWLILRYYMFTPQRQVCKIIPQY